VHPGNVEAHNQGTLSDHTGHRALRIHFQRWKVSRALAVSLEPEMDLASTPIGREPGSVTRAAGTDDVSIPLRARLARSTQKNELVGVSDR
jgi:hypothetical protein